MKNIKMLFLILAALPFYGWADGLVLAPTRVVFGPKDRVSELMVQNNTSTTRRYRVTLEDYTMAEDGAVNAVVSDTEVRPWSAKTMIRFMPRQVTLPPQSRQVVRLMVVRPEGLTNGEYHTHLLVSEVPAAAPKGPDEKGAPASPEDNSLAMSMGISYGMGIPLVVQHGKDLNATLTLEGAKMVRDPSTTLPRGVMLDIARAGNSEGHMMVRLLDSAGKSLMVDRVVRVYAERDKVMLPLLFPQALLNDENRLKSLGAVKVKAWRGLAVGAGDPDFEMNVGP